MLKFAKGSSAKSKVTRSPDTLITNDTVEFLLGISEGPIKGLRNGAQSFLVANTPLLDVDNKPNYSSFALQFWPGSPMGHVVTMELGGFASPVNIGVTLASGTAVTRSGTTHGIDAADFRIVVQGLVNQTDKGTFPAPISIKFEIKKATDASWQPAWVSDISSVDVAVPAPGTEATWQSFGSGGPKGYTYFDDVTAQTVTAPPVAAPAASGVVFAYDTGSSILYSWRGSAWNPEDLTPHMDGYEVLADGHRLYLNPYASGGAQEGDLWLKSPTELLVWNGGVWAIGGQYTPLSTLPTLPNGVWTSTEKVSSATAKDFRVFLTPDEDTNWQYRVTKLSADGDTELTSVVQWESVQEIKRRPWSFVNLAMVRLIGQSSDQFTSLPELTGDYDGRIVKVPANYNEITRVYTGIWDGTYKLAFTSNPAWVFQDFVENDTYGLSSVFPHTVNKWKIYEWAQNCDHPVSRPDATLRPRWTYNDYVQEARDAKEMAQYIAGSAGALAIDDGNGVIEVVIDQDESPVAIFTPENVGEEGFSYSYTDRLTRSNEVIIEFVNPNLNWVADKRVIRDEDDITAYGRISENFIAVGCTDEDEGVARARRRLIGGLTEKEMVTFTTNRQGRFLSEWNIILVADPLMGRGVTGRVKAILTSTSISLRDPITFDTGITYTATFTVTNPAYPATSSEPFATVRRQIANGAGTFSTLSFTTALPTLPPNATFALEAAGFIGLPKPFRITNIDDDSGTGEVIKITALELNRNKYAYIDDGVDLGTVDYGTVNKDIAPATNLRVETSVRQKGLISTRVATLRWDRSATSTVRKYTISHSLDGVPSVAPGDITENFCEFEGVGDGEHVFTVIAVDLFGRSSLPATIRYNTNGVSPMAGQFNFRLAGDTGTAFETIEPVFIWDPIQLVPHFDHYEILILHPTLNVPLRVENVGASLTWAYKFLINQADHGGTAPRSLRVGLRAVDQFGNSSAPDLLTVTNAAPAAPTGVTAFVDGDGLLVTWDTAVGTKDFGGTKIVCDIHPGATTLVFDGTGTQARIPVSATGDYYFKVGFYDLYDPNDVSYDIERSQGIAMLVSDTLHAFEDQLAAITALGVEVDAAAAAGEVLAESVIRDRLASIFEIRAREGNVTELTHTTETLRTDTNGLVNDVTTLITDTNDNFAIINTTLTTTSNLASASANELHYLGAMNGAGTAFVIDTNTAYIDAVTSLASRLTLTEARFGGSSSSFLLSTINTAATNASSAITRTNLMGATNGSNTGFVVDTTKLFIGADGTSLASYIQGLSITSGAASALADSRIAVSLGPGGSIASALTTVTSTAGTASSNASIALNTANGDTASVAVLTRVGNRITGFRVNGANGDFVIDASKFIIVDTSGGSAVIPFSIISGLASFANPVQIVSGATKLIMGPAFGASSDLLLWFGATATSIATATRSNALFALCADGTIKIPSSGGVAPLVVTKSGNATWVGLSPGTETTNAPTISVTGGSGSYSYSWGYVRGDATFTINTPTASASSFSKVVAPGDFFLGTYRCTVTDTSTGVFGFVDVNVSFTDSH